MAKCQYPACAHTAADRGRFCSRHQKTANLTLPSTPMAVQVMEQLEWDRLQATMVTRDRRSGAAVLPRARATPPQNLVGGPKPVHAARPLALGSVASAAEERVAQDQARNMERMRISYAALLEARKTDRELLKPLEDAFNAVKLASRFKHYHEAETAWMNRSALAGRVLRAAAPAMIMRPIAADVRDRLRALSLSFMTADKAYAERYCFELSLYCDAVITKQDVSFIFGQASLVLGPVLAPVVAPAVAASQAVGSAAASGVGAGVAAHAAGAGAAKAVTTAPKVAAKKGLEKLVVNEPAYSTIPVDSYKSKQTGLVGFVSRAASSADDPMRFTLAWLNFVTKEKEPAAAVATIVKEFGGMSACVNLLEFLTCSNL